MLAIPAISWGHVEWAHFAFLTKSRCVVWFLQSDKSFIFIFSAFSVFSCFFFLRCYPCLACVWINYIVLLVVWQPKWEVSLHSSKKLIGFFFIFVKKTLSSTVVCWLLHGHSTVLTKRGLHEKPSLVFQWRGFFQRVSREYPSVVPQLRGVFRRGFHEKPSVVPSRGFLTEHTDKTLSKTFTYNSVRETASPAYHTRPTNARQSVIRLLPHTRTIVRATSQLMDQIAPLNSTRSTVWNKEVSSHLCSSWCILMNCWSAWETVALAVPDS